MKARLNLGFARLPALLRGLGPYAAIELLLPGGSVIALLVWLCRHRANVATRTRGAHGLARAAPTVGESIGIPSHLSLPSLDIRSLDCFAAAYFRRRHNEDRGFNRSNVRHCKQPSATTRRLN
jgi:hypothetical protein